MADKQPTIRREKGQYVLRINFKEDELGQLGRDMAQALLEAQEGEDELKSVQSQIKSKINEALARAKTNAEKIRSGYEYRKVNCTAVYDYDKGVIDYVDEANGCMWLAQRTMTGSEKQLPLTVPEPSWATGGQVAELTDEEKRLAAGGADSLGPVPSGKEFPPVSYATAGILEREPASEPAAAVAAEPEAPAQPPKRRGRPKKIKDVPDAQECPF